MSQQMQQFTFIQQQRSLYEDSRIKLCEKMTQNVHNVGSLCRQIIKSSRTNDILAHSAKNFATQIDVQINAGETNLKKWHSTMANLNEQLNQIEHIVAEQSL
ncbi:BLOC-1 related complex subunit 7 [Dermatophagoides farinae]|uniref:BLOC-1 related complex subunit 7 n=1 Tax=Dermatophagoides farinae TaxID=6954 RepID=UPI003F60A5C0